MAKTTASTVTMSDKIRIIKFMLKHFNNFKFLSHNNITIEVNQSITTTSIIALSNFATRYKYDLEISNKTLTFNF